MSQSRKRRLEHIRYLHNYSSLPSRLTFYWFTGLLRLGYRRPLEDEDLGELPDEEKTETQLTRLLDIYQTERASNDDRTFSLWRCLFRAIWKSMLAGGVYRLLADFMGFIAPLGIKGIVAYTERNYTSVDSDVSDDSLSEHDFSYNFTITEILSNGYVMAVIVLVSSLLQSTFSQCSTFLVNSEGIHIKFALQPMKILTVNMISAALHSLVITYGGITSKALIYKKSLTLSPNKSSINGSTDESDDDRVSTDAPPTEQDNEDKRSGGSESTRDNSNSRGFDNGSIINIMSEDTNNIMMFFWMAHFIWAIPLKLAILMTLLYFQLGYSALIGAGVCILVMIPLQFFIGRKMSSNSKLLMERCDERLRKISEILQGIKLLKLHGWELLFCKKVFDVREKELKNLDRDLLYRSIMTFMTHISSVLVTVVTFGLYPHIESDMLEPPKVFAGLALFNQLTVPLFIFPITVPVVIDALVRKCSMAVRSSSEDGMDGQPRGLSPTVLQPSPTINPPNQRDVSARRIREFLLLPEAASLPVNDGPDEESATSKNSNGNGEIAEQAELPAVSSSKNVTLGKSLGLIGSKVNSSARNIPDLNESSDSVFLALENIEEDEEEEQSNELEQKETVLSHGDNRLVADEEQPDSVVCLENASFSWNEQRGIEQVDEEAALMDDLSIGLKNISLQIPRDKLTVFVGPTGSGKSSLICALLGEMAQVENTKSKNNMKWASHTKIAYAAQKPWILNATIRENIIFGKQFKPRRFRRVVQACALEPDLQILPETDLTEIGNKGINLSGGQKQRIAIARVLYSNANVVILDDPLSALDVIVAHHVLHEGIIKFLLRSRRTVILATHHLPVLHHAYHIVALEKGQIRVQGSLSEIQREDPVCYKNWEEMITKKEHELQVQREAKTAKERWTLLKLVSKVGLQFKQTRGDDKSDWRSTDEHDSRLTPFRGRKGGFSHYKNLSHDIFLPSDECHDEIITPLLRRRAVSRTSRESRASQSSAKHKQLQRMSSLQPESEAGGKMRSPSVGKKFKRLQSLPVDDQISYTTPTINSVFVGGSPPGPPGLDMTGISRETPSSPLRNTENLFKKLFSSKKMISSTSSSNPELEKIPSNPPTTPKTQRLTSIISGGSEGEVTEEEGDEEESFINRDSSQEEREYGKIPMRVYLSYIEACGKVISSLYLYSAIGYEIVRVLTNLWLSQWSDAANQVKDDQDKYNEAMAYYFNIYVILSVATVIVSLSSNLLGKQAGANSREILHKRALERVVKCPVRFFETTPIGRIINRFSSDVAVVDRKLCISMQRFLQFVFLCFSAIVVNAIVNVWFILLAIPIVAVYYYIQRFYRFSSRELQRIQAISRGPIYSQFHETLEGISTIRAFRDQERFTGRMLATLDAHNRADLFINVGNRWLSISLDYLGGVIVFLATLVAVVSAKLYPDAVTASMVGLSINYTLLVPVYLNWVVKFLAEVEMFMNSVDRIDRYANLEIEDYDCTTPENALLPTNWPPIGEVKFDNVSVQYGIDRPPIISNLNVNVNPSEKVGICGRSGSGKSSLLMALFKISDVKTGQIIIDGVNIHHIPLLTLRSSFSIIPQENIIFSETLRFNLDPEGKSTDNEIWSALEQCQMKQSVQRMHGQLDADIRYGGDCFSAGEKQLLALARAILRKSKIVILDEATSSVDVTTERTLLEVVKDVFSDSTVLTVAHRLDTIIDGDRVLVLEDGKLVEDGRPSVLMKKPMSHFATLLRNAGEQSKPHK